MPDLSNISREELAELWDAVDAAMYVWHEHAKQHNGAGWAAFPWDNKPAYNTAWGIAMEVNTSRHWPAMTDAQLLRYLKRSEAFWPSWRRAVQGLAWRADRSFPLPPVICEELRRLLGEVTPRVYEIHAFRGTGAPLPYERDPRDLLCIARHLQPDEGGPEVDLICQLMRNDCAATDYLKIELEVFLSLSRADVCRQCRPDASFSYLNDHRYKNLPEQFLRHACTRLEAIHSGSLPYVGYKAFAEHDVSVLCWAYRTLNRMKAPWLAEVAHRVLTLSCHAPDKKSKSMPSQTLTCRLAEEISLKPTPQGIASLNEAYGLAINATVKKTLAIRLAQAKRDMALRPDIVLELVASSPPDKKQQTMLATLLQASYCTGLDFSRADWQRQLIDAPGAADFSRQLIWWAQAPDANQASVAFVIEGTDSSDKELILVNHSSQPVQVPSTWRICLWHPLHGSVQERAQWQLYFLKRHIKQPVRQAFREHYEALPQELQRPDSEAGRDWRSNESWRFAGYTVSLKPLIGLARGQGWKIERESGLTRVFADMLVCLGVDEDIYPGITGGEGPSGALTFWKGTQGLSVRMPIRQVPPIVYSEACRAADLLVSVCAFAFTADDASEPLTTEDAGIHFSGDEPPSSTTALHPQLQRANRLSYLGRLNLADMAAMRWGVLAQAFAAQIDSGDLVLHGRSAQISSYTLNLATAQVFDAGEHIDIRLPKDGKPGKANKLGIVPWLPYDEALLEKLVKTIAYLL